MESKKKRPAFIPQNKISAGDIVALKEYDLYSHRLDDDERYWSGIIVSVNKSRLVLCLGESGSTENFKTLPNVMGLCKM